MSHNVIFINPPNIPFTDKSILIEPIDILTLSSYIQSLGHNVSFLDMDAEHILPKDILSYLEKDSPDILILPFDYHIPLHQDNVLSYIMDICEIAKERGIKTIVGGKIATYRPDTLIYPDSPVDIAISYEMETALADLLSGRQRDCKHLTQIQNISFLSDNKMIRTSFNKQKFAIDTLPIADRNLCRLEKYIDVRSMLSSRGCVMHCSYCHVPDFWSTWTGRSPEHVLQEIQSLIKDFGAQKIIFLDDNFAADRQRMERIADLILENNIICKFGFLSTLYSFDEALFQKLYRAGFRRVHYGVETGDEKLSKDIHKNLSNAFIKKIIQKTKDIGFRIRSSRIIDLPGSTTESIDKTLQLILETETDEIRVHFLSLRLGSKIYTDLGATPKTIPSQYIHHNTIHNTLHSVDEAYIRQKLSTMIETLQKDKYLSIQDIKDNKKLHTVSQHQQIKVISFCPLRYGLCR